MLVVAAVDRLGRDLIEGLIRRRELATLGVPTHFVREGGVLDDLHATLLMAFAQRERAQLRQRVVRSWQEISRRGWHFVGRVPFGYCLRDATDQERAWRAPAGA